MTDVDIAVVGLGLIGSATLRALTRRGMDAVGFDPLPVGSTRGSSHGSCRVFRRFNFESAAYTALSDQAFAGWTALEAESGARVLLPSPVLEAGPPGSAMVAASRAAAAAAGLAGGPRTGADANAAFPALRLPRDWDVAVQPGGGVLLAQAALRALRDGCRIVGAATRIEPELDAVHIRWASGDVSARQVIVAAGPWIADLVPQLRPLLRITRQTVGWFAPTRPQEVGLGRLPIFLLESPHGLVYGFPDFEGRGVKAARHDHGAVVTADAWDPPASDAELAPVRATLEALIPAAAGPIVGRDVCLYTNTLAADARPDTGEEFILDRLPSDRRIIVASACSGHGAKFATALGESLARLALEPAYEADPAFRLDRFSAFAVVGGQ